jgi:flavorubredoxin
MTTELKPNIHWVGYVDWDVRDFHSYDTKRGATYNAYLVQDDKTALIDTVKAPFAGHLLCNLSEKTSLEAIDYVVCNHAEPDHSGALPEVMKALPNAKLLCNEKCRSALASHYDIGEWDIQLVSPEDEISLGNRTLTFMNTPMVHWPESMFTYVPEEKLLFSMDAFGQHLATSVRFDDQWPLCMTMMEAKTYYANIVNPYSKAVQRTLEAAGDLEIDMVAPSHGLIWRSHIPDILSSYRKWANGEYKPKVLVLYDTMWESTVRMAEVIQDGAISIDGSLDVQRLHVRRTSLTRIATELLDSASVACGSSTLNTQMMPMLSAVLTYAKGLRFSPKASVAFGSSGWGIGGPEQIHKWFEEAKWESVREPVKANYRPDEEVLKQCREAGEMLGRKAVEKASGNLEVGTPLCADP